MNPYLTNKKENNLPVNDAENASLNAIEAFITITSELSCVMDTLTFS